MKLLEVPNGEMFTSNRMIGTFWRSNEYAFRIGGKAIVYSEEDVGDCTIYSPPEDYAKGALTPPSEFQAVLSMSGYPGLRSLLEAREEYLLTIDEPVHRLLCALEIQQLKTMLVYEDY